MLRTMMNERQVNSESHLNQKYNQWAKNNMRSTNNFASENLNSNKFLPENRRKNLQGYTFGGMKNIRSSTMYGGMNPNMYNMTSEQQNFSEYPVETGGEVLTGFERTSRDSTNPNIIQLERPKYPKVKNFFDQAYGTNVVKRARDRPQSCKSEYSAKSSTINKLKSYKPANPYQNTQTQFFNNQQKGQRSEERNGVQRFNENVSVTSKQVTEHRKRKPHSTSRKIIRDNHSRSTADAVKREIERRKQAEKEAAERQAQVTGNNIGPYTYQEEQYNEQPEYNEERDIDANSRLSNKTYICNLRKAIDEEKEKRLELEKQIEDLRRLNQEISSHLELNTNQN